MPISGGPVEFYRDIMRLFSQSQRDCMLVARKFDLHKPDDVKLWHKKIVSKLKNGSMPTDGTAPWPADRIALIEQWKTDGFIVDIALP